MKNIQTNIKKEKQLFKNIFYMGILQGSNILLPLILVPYLILTLGSEKFGLIMFANSFIIYFVTLTSFGFNISATRNISLYRDKPDQISKIFTTVMFIKIILLLISFLIFSILIYSIELFNTDWQIFLYYFGLVIGQVLFPIWYFQGLEKMKYITYINLGSKILVLILILVFVNDSRDYTIVPIIYSFGAILSGLIAFIIAYKSISFKVFTYNDVKETFMDSLKIFISNASINLYTNTNIFLLGIFTNYQIVGIYAGFEKIISAIKGMIQAVFQAIFPWLSNKKDIKKYINIILPIISLITLLGSIIIYYFSNEILELIFNDTSMMNYSYLFQIMLVIPFLASLNMIYNFLYLNAIKAYTQRMNMMLIVGTTSIIFGVTLTFFLGVEGTVINIIFIELLLLYMGYKLFTKTNIVPEKK